MVALHSCKLQISYHLKTIQDLGLSLYLANQLTISFTALMLARTRHFTYLPECILLLGLVLFFGIRIQDLRRLILQRLYSCLDHALFSHSAHLLIVFLARLDFIDKELPIMNDLILKFCIVVN